MFPVKFIGLSRFCENSVKVAMAYAYWFNCIQTLAFDPNIKCMSYKDYCIELAV